MPDRSLIREPMPDPVRQPHLWVRRVWREKDDTEMASVLHVTTRKVELMRLTMGLTPGVRERCQWTTVEREKSEYYRWYR